MMEGEHMIAKPLYACDVGMGRDAIRSQELRKTINIARVNHLLEEAACEQLILRFRRHDELSNVINVPLRHGRWKPESSGNEGASAAGGKWPN